MSVIIFPVRSFLDPRSWSSQELETLVALHEEGMAHGEAFAWDVGATELNDPQFYILGRAPNLECLLTISRVGSIYVLENGRGQVLQESPSLDSIAESASRAISGRRAGLVSRFIVGFGGARAAIEERWEPMLAESEELLLRVAPQLAMLA